MKKVLAILAIVMMGLGCVSTVLPQIASAAVGDIWVDQDGNEYVETTPDDPNATHEITN